jgi:hypothetical protein
VCGRTGNINGHLLRPLRHRVAAEAARGLRSDLYLAKTSIPS